MTFPLGNVFPRSLNPLPAAVKAEGMWLYDDKGKRYLDASGGAVVVNLGHGRAEVIQAMTEQLKKGYYYHPTMFTSQPAEDLAEALAGHAPPGLSRFYFLSGGGEAVETSIKLARQIHLAHGRATRHKLIARWKSYHGLTLGALAATGRTVFRTPFAPMLPETLHIPAPYCLRCAYGLEHPECGLRCAMALEETIQGEGTSTISAFLAETVSGATIAAAPPPEGYWPLVREICDRYGVLLIHDEVLCGMGRTGQWFASQHYETWPDIMVLGKGLSGGAIALSAVATSEEHYQAVQEAGGFMHGGTFSHHPVACAAGLAAVGVLEKDGLVERAAEKGAELGSVLRERLSGLDHVADVRGLGMLWGVEIVAEKETRKPFPRAQKVAEQLIANLKGQGVILYKSVGLAGVDGDALVVAPPFIIEREQMETVAEAVAKALGEVLD
jgi:adenosylmethionine-8-amino-7-oxononanoate aminotransferase